MPIPKYSEFPQNILVPKVAWPQHCSVLDAHTIYHHWLCLEWERNGKPTWRRVK